jgi:hypothetical protein
LPSYSNGLSTMLAIAGGGEGGYST